MKIKEWEDIVGKKYPFIKESNISNLKHFFVEKTNNELFCILKQNDLFLYLETNDGKHLTGIISNSPNEFNKYNFEFVRNRKNSSRIELKEFIEYFGLKEFDLILPNNAVVNDLEFYDKRKAIKVSKLTDNKIEDEEFYAFYIFNDDVIFSQNDKLMCSGEYIDTIVLLGSKNNEDVQSIFVLNSGKENPKDYKKFLNDICFDEINNSLKIKG